MMILRGVYVVRGQDYEPAFGVNDMVESYKYTRLDASKPEDRKIIEDEWAQNEKKSTDVDGKKLPYWDGKYFY